MRFQNFEKKRGRKIMIKGIYIVSFSFFKTLKSEQNSKLISIVTIDKQQSRSYE